MKYYIDNTIQILILNEVLLKQCNTNTDFKWGRENTTSYFNHQVTQWTLSYFDTRIVVSMVTSIGAFTIQIPLIVLLRLWPLTLCGNVTVMATSFFTVALISRKPSSKTRHTTQNLINNYILEITLQRSHAMLGEECAVTLTFNLDGNSSAFCSQINVPPSSPNSCMNTKQQYAYTITIGFFY